MLKIGDHQLEEVSKIQYVGEGFNHKGNNNDLVEDRVAKGIKCIRSCVAEACDITLGVHAIESLLVMYKSVFLHTVLYNCGSWCNLTQINKDSLSGVQMKFLRRMLHIPSSTPCSTIFRELGVIPIVNELESRQLFYLHHILSLDQDDPLRCVIWVAAINQP